MPWVKNLSIPGKLFPSILQGHYSGSLSNLYVKKENRNLSKIVCFCFVLISANYKEPMELFDFDSWYLKSSCKL